VERNEFEHFRDLTADYCNLIERFEELDWRQTTKQLRVLIPSLMSAAIKMSDASPTDNDAPSTVTHEQWSDRLSAVEATLSEHGSYWTTPDVVDSSEPEVVNLPIADDLADIWRDLRDGLNRLEAGGQLSDIAWEWRFLFDVHWGAHAAEAIRALHALATSTDAAEDI
jgi:hypothetical protein